MEGREDRFLSTPQAPLSWNCVGSGSLSRKAACLQPSGESLQVELGRQSMLGRGLVTTPALPS